MNGRIQKEQDSRKIYMKIDAKQKIILIYQ